MESHYRLSDEQFEIQFRKGSFDPSLFSHEAHLRLAWIHLRKTGIEEACEEVSAQIKAFASAHGAPDKYNDTVTIAAIKAVDHFMRRSKADSFKGLIQESPRLKTKFKDLLDSHYSIDIFNSPEARRKFLDPDVAPFD